MSGIIKAGPEHVDGIAHVCSLAYWSTYSQLCKKEYIERELNMARRKGIANPFFKARLRY